MKKAFAILLLSLMTFLVNAQCELEPRYYGTDITKVSLEGIIFIDETLGYVSGDDGTFLKTTDAGATWEKMDLDIPQYTFSYGMRATPAKDSLILYAGGLYVFSVEEETLSEKITVPATATTFEIAPNNKWYINTNTDETYVSSDQGSTWETIEILEGAHDFEFVDENIGYAVLSESVYQTIDGGESWGLFYNGENIGSSIEINNGSIYMGGSDGINVSDDDGETWGFKDFGGYTSDIGKTASRLHFDNANNGYVIVSDYNDLEETRPLLKTSDGGDTWEELTTIKNGFNQWFNAWAFKDSKLFLSGRFGLLVEMDLTDNSWKKINGEYAPSLNEVEQAPNGDIYIGGTGSQLIKIPNGTDDLQIDTLTFDEDIYQIDFYNSDSLIIQTRYDLYLVADENETIINLLSTPDDYQWDFTIQSDTILLSSSSQLHYTVDFGESWIDIFPLEGYTEDLSIISSTLLNKNEWLIGVTGDFGAILRTDDGGETWSEVQRTELDYAYVLKFDFVDEKVGFAVGGYDAYFKTDDGGLTWESFTFNYTNELIDVDFIDADNGIVTGNYYIHITHDGGISWEKIFRSETDYILGLFFVDDYHIYSVGRGGEMVEIVGAAEFEELTDTDSVACINTDFNYSITNESGMIYKWYYEDQLVSNTNSLSINFEEVGEREVLLVRKNVCDEIDSTSLTIEVVDFYEISELQSNDDTLACAKIEFDYSLENEEDTNYEWFYNEELVSSTNSLSIIFEEIGSKDLLLVRENICEAVDSTNIIIDVIDVPEIPEITFAEDTLSTNIVEHDIAWLLNDEVLTDEDTTYIIPMMSGTYQAQATNICASILSDEYLIEGLILNIQHQLESSFQMYPNPASVTVKVVLDKGQTAGSGVEKIEIWSISGNMVSTQDVNNDSSILLTVHDLKSGTYFVKMITEKGILNKKLIVN